MALAEVKEAYDKGASEDVGRLSIAHDILRKNTDYSRIVIAPAFRVRRRDIVIRLPTLQVFSFVGLHMVAVIGARRRQQQQEEAV